MDEAVDIVRGLSAGGYFEYHGEVYDLPADQDQPHADRADPHAGGRARHAGSPTRRPL